MRSVRGGGHAGCPRPTRAKRTPLMGESRSQQGWGLSGGLLTLLFACPVELFHLNFWTEKQRLSILFLSPFYHVGFAFFHEKGLLSMFPSWLFSPLFLHVSLELLL